VRWLERADGSGQAGSARSVVALQQQVHHLAQRVAVDFGDRGGDDVGELV
jgi:hypothetical protein